MADDVSQIAFNPTPMGPPQSFTPNSPGIAPQDPSSPQWQQLLQAAQRGQISQAQLQQLAMKLGYQMPQQQQQPQAASPQQNANIGAQLGTAAGQIAGRAVQAMNNFTKPPAAAQGQVPPPNTGSPSPAWEQ